MCECSLSSFYSKKSNHQNHPECCIILHVQFLLICLPNKSWGLSFHLHVSSDRGYKEKVFSYSIDSGNKDAYFWFLRILSRSYYGYRYSTRVEYPWRSFRVERLIHLCGTGTCLNSSSRRLQIEGKILKPKNCCEPSVREGGLSVAGSINAESTRVPPKLPNKRAWRAQ